MMRCCCAFLGLRTTNRAVAMNARLRRKGCGYFATAEQLPHGGKHERWHERCALRAEEKQNFHEENHDVAGFDEAAKAQDEEW